jgi:shikimate kinase
MNIFLIGYRCTGKTTVGKALAQRLQRCFIDADEELTKENNISIADMVAQHGWDYFRQREREVIRRLSNFDNHVIATGGGAILNPENIRDMKKSGFVVWLTASPETIRYRIVKDKITDTQRPALTDKGLLEEIGEMLAIRNPLYETAMDMRVETDSLDADSICDAVIKKFK